MRKGLILVCLALCVLTSCSYNGTISRTEHERVVGLLEQVNDDTMDLVYDQAEEIELLELKLEAVTSDFNSKEVELKKAYEEIKASNELLLQDQLELEEKLSECLGLGF